MTRLKWNRSSVFDDGDHNMTTTLHRRHARLARDAAREAIGTVTLTARRQYRRYRRAHTQEYLSWDSWVRHYREVTDGPGSWSTGNDGMNNIAMNP